MARSVPLLSSFNGGEISPRLYGRADIAKYISSCRRLENFVPLIEGGVTRRPGTRYVASTKADAVVVLIGFVFSTEQAYAIEAGAGYFRFYRNGAPIESSPGVPYEIASPYGAADLAGLRWVQSADVLYLAHPNHAPRKLSRTAHTAWTLTTIAFLDGPYLPKNAGDVTFTSSVATGAGTLTASAATFVLGDVGRQVRLESGTTKGWGSITGFTSATVVNWTVATGETVPTAATKEWRLGAFGDTRGFPAAVTFHQDRLFWGRTAQRPQTLWGSVVGDYERHRPGANADDALNLTLNANTVNAIAWLDSGRYLTAGTTGGEWPIRGDEASGLTATNARTDQDTTVGSAEVPALRIDAVTLFVQRAGRRLRELIFDFNSDNLQANDLTTLAGHITRAGIVRMAYQQTPWRIVWMVLADGALIGLTYMREEKVVAWHRHPLGGANVRVLSLAVIPAATQDELWLVVERTVAGVTRRFVERMEPEFIGDTEAEKREAFFVDAGLSYSGAPTSTFTGLGHLEGETLAVLADGKPTTALVALGQIVLPFAAARVHAGLPFTSLMETVDLEGGAQDGTSQTRARQIHRLAVRLYQTMGCIVGWRRGAQSGRERIVFATDADPMDNSPALFTGDKPVTFPALADRQAIIVVEQDQPLPCTVTALVVTQNVGD
jgi:hypothetical protein